MKTDTKAQILDADSNVLLGKYVECGWRRAWIMWDMCNGHACNQSDPGKGYLWVFKTKREALLHRRKQHSNNLNARLSMPFKIECAQRPI